MLKKYLNDKSFNLLDKAIDILDKNQLEKFNRQLDFEIANKTIDQGNQFLNKIQQFKNEEIPQIYKENIINKDTIKEPKPQQPSENQSYLNNKAKEKIKTNPYKNYLGLKGNNFDKKI